MPETCENWLGLVNSCLYYARQTHDIYQVPGAVLLRGFQSSKGAPRELWNPLSKTQLSKYNFVWNKGTVNILNDDKAQK